MRVTVTGVKIKSFVSMGKHKMSLGRYSFTRKEVSLPDVQRLGFLLDRIGAVSPADPSALWLSMQPHRKIILRPGGPRETLSEGARRRFPVSRPDPYHAGHAEEFMRNAVVIKRSHSVELDRERLAC